MAPKSKLNIMNLPEDVLEKILSYISYDDISRCRLVCKQLDALSKRLLNRGFHRVERYHAQCLKNVKAQLPRRESERRKHPLARHCDILTAVETRLSLLGMTFMKYIELNFCCFIPGKVLDEIYRVLRYVQSEQTPVRAHEVLQELRDLSSMAMEHFDEKISPVYRKRKDVGPKIMTPSGHLVPPPPFHNPSCSYFTVESTSERRSHRWREEVKSLTAKCTANRRETQSLKRTVKELTKNNAELEKKVIELQNLLTAHIEQTRGKLQDPDYATLVTANKNSFPPDSVTVSSISTTESTPGVTVGNPSLVLDDFKQRKQTRGKLRGHDYATPVTANKNSFPPDGVTVCSISATDSTPGVTESMVSDDSKDTLNVLRKRKVPSYLSEARSKRPRNI